MTPNTIRIEIIFCKYSVIYITPWSTVFIKIMIMNFGVYHNRDFDAGLVYEPTYGCDTFEDTRFYGCSGIFHTNDLGSRFYYRCGSLSTHYHYCTDRFPASSFDLGLMNGASDWDYSSGGLYSIHGNHVAARGGSQCFRSIFIHILF